MFSNVTYYNLFNQLTEYCKIEKKHYRLLFIIIKIKIFNKFKYIDLIFFFYFVNTLSALFSHWKKC